MSWSNPVREKLTDDERERTRWIYQKPYHWTLIDGTVVLEPGPTEHEEIRWKAVDKLVEKGMDPNLITAEMIDSVVAKAESAAIMAAVGEDKNAPQEEV